MARVASLPWPAPMEDTALELTFGYKVSEIMVVLEHMLSLHRGTRFGLHSRCHACAPTHDDLS